MYKNEKASSPPVNNKVVDFCCGKIIMLLSDHPSKLFTRTQTAAFIF